MALTFSSLGGTSKGGIVVASQVHLTDGVTAPAAAAGVAKLYVDTADGDLKVEFGDDFGAVVQADS